ncbi:aromatic amino acid aminotransferase -like [Lecanosticta acicola]|uniref:Aromatic amino acid aminotransferase -like n=1 Tax=Lecanosticta acicola TaxID=111012 RepID=A0AAI8YSQ6_9PEZI|nr:aromatic amino acid aminotransferase -like [Lecanosticta acicola]
MDTRSPPKDLSHHLSRATKSRKESSIKSFYKYFQIPGIGQLAGGLPNKYYFPYDTLEAKVARPDRWQPTGNRPVDPPTDDEALCALSLRDDKTKTASGPLNQPEDQIVVPHTSKQTNPTKKIDLSVALQYGTAQGFPPLYYFVREFTRENLHPNCPYKGGPEVMLSCGNTDGLAKVLLAMSNEWSEEKDWIRDREGILVEHFAYMNAIQQAHPRGLNVVPVAIDDEGMVTEGPGGLKDVLKNWDYNKGKLPHLMYTVTMGQNPTSGVLSLQRRRDIYDLCCKYDIIIVEDDPYWYLQFPSATAVNTTTTSHPENTSFNPEVRMFANGEAHPDGWKSSGYDFLDSLVPSSINIDTEGRVIRLDTFSKTVAPGCRLGWITAQPAFIERLLRISETTTQAPSGFVQSLVAELVLGPDHEGLNDAKAMLKDGKGGLPSGKGWKADGWVRWLEGLRGNYERRMNQMARILELKQSQVKAGRRNSLDAETEDAEDEWSVVEKVQMHSFVWPVGGMFLWIKIHFENHPLYSTFKKASPDGLTRLSKALWIFWTTKPYLVLGAPGTMFSPTEEIKAAEGWKYFRLCFAAIDEEELGPVSHRFADGIAAFWRIKDEKVIEKILQEDEAEAKSAHLTQMIGPC